MATSSLVGLPAPHSRQPAVLVVDDEPDVRALLDTLLQDEGYRSVSRSSPAQALALLRVFRFALILTDSFSATPAALDSTRPLVAAAGATPVVLCTAHAVDEAAARVAGFAALVPKPFDVAELLATVARLLGEPSVAA